MADAETETETVIVVGMNRTRLLKIMDMVAAETVTGEAVFGKDGRQQQHHHQAVEYVSCVAAMSSYEGEDGKDTRYMSSFVFHDGSPMNQFFDDEGFRASLKKIVMVGYEWKESDDDLVTKYFEAFQLPVEIDCVVPNPGFSSLSEEMQHYKTLTTEEKEDHTTNHTMGPGKMQRFILDALRSSESIVDPNEKTTIGGTTESKEATGAEEKEEIPEEIRTPNHIDHNATTFACRMCRTVLLDASHLAEDHIQNQHTFRNGAHKYTTTGGSRCQSLFCDESVLEWLAPRGAEYDAEGKLSCPKCSFKVGHYNWSGAQCSCGTWVVPAIQIPLGKVDVILPLSERRKLSPMVVIGPTVY
jgi:dual specificity phosphatase 12